MEVNIVKVDVTKHRVHPVRSIPTIVFFPKEGEHIDYKKARKKEVVIEWVKQQVSTKEKIEL